MHLWKIPDVPENQHLYHVKIGKRMTHAYTQVVLIANLDTT